MPETHRVEAAEAFRRLAPLDAEPTLNGLQAPVEAEAVEGMHQVHMDLAEGHPGKGPLQEGHVEPQAVEGHEHFPPIEGARQFLHVDPFDEGSLAIPIIDPNDGHRVPADGEARGLDVEERRLPPEVRPCAPMLSRLKSRREVAVAPSGQSLLGANELLRNPSGDCERETPLHPGQGEVVPGPDAGMPEGLLPARTNPGHVEEGLPEHAPGDGAGRIAFAGRSENRRRGGTVGPEAAKGIFAGLPWPRVFELRERDGLGRIGLLETPHGRVVTPALLPVVNPNRPIIPPAELAARFGAEILITNAYILGKEPLREAVAKVGVHRLLGFDRAIMTDSGAFQSHVYGDVDVTNAEIIGFQKAIGSDLGTMLDVFSEPEHDYARARRDMEETLRRAAEAARLRGEMILVGAVQGGVHEDLRERCAREVSALDIGVAAIGGVVPLMEAYRFRDLVRVIVAAKKGLDPSKPVHLFGAGHPLVFPLAALLGCDLFDSAAYAKYARDGRMMFADGTRRATDAKESGCLCSVCTSHPMESIAADERLIAEHNLHVSFAAVREVRRAISSGDLWELAERRARAHPALLDALRELRRHSEFLEEWEPVSRPGALYFVGPETPHRPVLHRLRRRLQERYAPPPAKGLVVFPEDGRPYSDRYRHALEKILRTADVHAVVKSIWGPVPIELDHLWPFSQSIVPVDLDPESLEAAEVFFRQWAEGAGYPFGLLWEGDPSLPELGRRAPGPREVDWNLLRIRGTADVQFGRTAAGALFRGRVSYVTSKNTGKIRNILVDGEHVLSLRAEDGLFTLKVPGARRLQKAFPFPRLRVVVDPDAVPFHRGGKNVMAKFVKDADPEIRPRDEALVVSPEDELCAVAQAAMNRREMLAFKRGIAAFVREGVPPLPSAPPR